ncbi:signal transduction histidine kinase [Elusimicrobium posterum]|uniref:sensor histidine kinase n=1 Tax=Elusimicrobium posterum TaxID=3116653 RepID=UPI003C7297FE
MKNISLRLRVALSFGLMVLLLSNVYFFIAYKAVQGIIMEQRKKSFTRDSALIKKNVYTQHGLPVFEGALTPEMNYTFFAADGKWAGGDDFAWMNNIPKTNAAQLHYIKRPEGGWYFYDTDLYEEDKYLGFVRLFLGPNLYIDDNEERRYVSLYLYFMAASIIIALLVGVWIMGRALKNLKSITLTAVEIGKGDLTKRINWRGAKDEIGILANTLDDMADNLQKMLEWEKQFTSDVSHEIRTPVASIITNAENAEYRDDIEVYRSSIKNILAKSRQMQNLVKQLLMLAREREQAAQLNYEDINLEIVLNDIAEELREQAAPKEISVTTDIAPGLTLRADLTLFTRLMINIVSNSVKYGVSGGYIKISAIQENEFIKIKISDNGIGISEKDLPYIFQRFYRADKSRSGAGAGLGLAFAEMIVKMHHGKIFVESAPGLGSAFTLQFPNIS